MKKECLLPCLGSHSGPPTTDFERLQTSSCTSLGSVTISHAHLVPDKSCFFDAFTPFLSLLAYPLYSPTLSLVSHETTSTKARVILMISVHNKK